MIHDPLCQLGVPCRSTEDGKHWEITRAAGMELNAPICEACVDWCDCLRVQAIRDSERARLVVSIQQDWEEQCAGWKSMECESCRRYLDVLQIVDPAFVGWSGELVPKVIPIKEVGSE
jgi:hypothetical protein